MGSLTDGLETNLLNHVFRNTAYTSPTTVYVGLVTDTPTDSAAGTEITGHSYARQPVTFGAPSGGAISNSADVLFPASTGGAYPAPVHGFEIWDASSGGNRIGWGVLAGDVTINGTDQFKFAAGAIAISLD